MTSGFIIFPFYISIMKRFFEKHLILLNSLIILFVYYLTSAKSLVSLDNGELITTSYLLGIPHPTGYPLFTILGFLFSKLPLPLSPIEKMSLLSALFVTVSAFFVMKIFSLLLENFEKGLDGKLSFQPKELTKFAKSFLIITGGYIFAFNKNIWYQSTNYEVYSLAVTFFAMVIFFTIKAFFDEFNGVGKEKNWLCVFIMYGIMLTHHLTSLFVIIPVLYLYFRDIRIQKFKSLIKYFLIICFIVVIIYSYIPIRANSGAIAGFGLPKTFNEVIDHITAKEYRPMFLQSFDVFLSNLGFFFSSLMVHFNLNDFGGSEFNLLIVFSLFGFFYLFKFFKRIFLFFFTVFLIYLFIPSFYGAMDIDSFYVLTYFTLSIFIWAGIYFLVRILQLNFNVKFGYTFILILIAILFYTNFNRVDQSKNFVMEDYYKSITKNVETNAVILNSSSWLHSMSLYYHFIEKFRPDVVLVTYPITMYPWYVDQINRLVAEDKIIEIKDNSLTYNFSKRDIYLTYEMFNKVYNGELKFSEDLELVPFGLLFKLTKKGEYLIQKDDMYNLQMSNLNISTYQELQEIIKDMMLRRIYYELDFNQVERAKKLLIMFKEKYPEVVIPKHLKNLLSD